MAIPIMARLFTPEDFGLFAVFTSVSTIIATVITLRYETTILLPKQEKVAVWLVLLSIKVAFFCALLIGLFTLIMPEYLMQKAGILGLKSWLVLAVFCGFAGSIVNITTAWFNRNKFYLKISIVKIMQSGLTVSLSLWLGFWGVATGMIVAYMAAFFIILISLLIMLWPLYKKFRVNKLIYVAKSYVAAPKYLFPTSLLDIVTMHLPIFLITSWFGGALAGQFSMAWKFLGLPSALIGAAVSQVFFQRFSGLWPNAIACKKLLIQTWINLAIIGFLPMITITFFGETIFIFLLGNEWREAGLIAEIIAVMVFVMLISSPTSSNFLILGLQKYSLFSSKSWTRPN
jgi:O-antigen/teichoic acid export membrane protein